MKPTQLHLPAAPEVGWLQSNQIAGWCKLTGPCRAPSADVVLTEAGGQTKESDGEVVFMCGRVRKRWRTGQNRWRSAAASCRDAAAQVLHHRLGSSGHHRCPRNAERVPFQAEAPEGRAEGHSQVSAPEATPLRHTHTHLRLVHSPSSGGTFSTSLLDRSRVDSLLSFIRPLGSTPSTWLLPSKMVSRDRM